MPCLWNIAFVDKKGVSGHILWLHSKTGCKIWPIPFIFQKNRFTDQQIILLESLWYFTVFFNVGHVVLFLWTKEKLLPKSCHSMSFCHKRHCKNVFKWKLSNFLGSYLNFHISKFQKYKIITCSMWDSRHEGMHFKLWVMSKILLAFLVAESWQIVSS